MRSARPPARRDQSTAPRGFTLLELLLAVLLAAALMAALWGLLGVYSRLFRAGYEETRRLQALHGVLAAISQDLQAAAPTAAPGGAAGIRRSGLLGGPDWLLVDVYAEVDPEIAGDDDPAQWEPAVQNPPHQRALHSVIYSLGEVQDEQAPPGRSARRLKRETLPWPAARNGAWSAPREEPAAGQATTVEPPRDTATEPREALVVREVESLSLRYFDGAAWRSTWSGSAMPVAVEVRLAPLADPDESAAGSRRRDPPRAPAPAAANAPAAARTAATRAAPHGPAPQARDGEVRQVILLGAARPAAEAVP